MANATLAQIPALIAARKAFKGNSVSAAVREDSKNVPGYSSIFTGAGRLNSTECKRFDDDYDRIVYVVKSYDTPIAWVTNDGTVYIVSQKFSVTTSKHQGKVRYGFAL